MAKPIPFKDIPHKVDIGQFARPSDPIWPYPYILGGENLNELVFRLREAKRLKKPIIWGLGAYVTKCGLSPLLLELDRMGYVTHLVMNGAALIHDVEIAMFGETSEWVENGLQKGLFGFSDETGLAFVDACDMYKRDWKLINGIYGLAPWVKMANEDLFKYKSFSLVSSFTGDILCFSSIGTETIYQHPSMTYTQCGAIGEMSKIDFDKFTCYIQGLGDGGVYINCCSSVVLPEIFMKCFSIVANEGHAPKPKSWTAVVLDKREQYRCTENVLKRPGGNPIQLLGEIEITIPVIYRALKEVPDFNLSKR